MVCKRLERSVGGPQSRLSAMRLPKEAQADFTQSFEKLGDLRFGKNPHQKAALYRDLFAHKPLSVASARKNDAP